MARRRQPYPWLGTQLPVPQPFQAMPTLVAAQPSFPDPMDPMAFMDRQDQGDQGDNWGYGGGQGAAPEPDLPPEEQRSLLGGSMSALGYLGESIGKPGYAVRALAAGDPAGAALNLIPFYDTIRENLAPNLPEAPKISGEQLLSDKWGIMDKPEGWFTGEGPLGLGGDTLRKLAGLGTELVDPLLLAGTTGLTTRGVTKMLGKEAVATDVAKAGEQALKGMGSAAEQVTARIMGVTPAARAAEIAAGERALAGIYLPWSKKPIAGLTTNFGLAPETAAKVYGAAYLNPVSVGMRGLFSHVPGVGGKYTAEAQKLTDLKYAEARRLTGLAEDLAPVLSGKMDDLYQMTQEAAKHAASQQDPISRQAFEELGRSMIETPGGIPDAKALAASMKARLGLPMESQSIAWGDLGRIGDVGPTATMSIKDASGKIIAAQQPWESIGQDFYNVFDVMKRTEDAALARIRSLGGTVKDLDDAFVEHYFRGATSALKKEAREAIALGGEEAKFRLRRKDYVRDFPGGTAAVNETVRNPVLLGVHVLSETTPVDVSGNLVAGAIVKASDRANYGRVLEVGKDTSKVYFRSKGGAEAIVDLPNTALTPTRKAAPKGLETPPLVVPMTADEQRKALEQAIIAKGKLPVQGASVAKLQEQYLLEEHIKPRLQPALDASLAAGKIDEEKYAKIMGEWGFSLNPTTKEWVQQPIVSAIGQKTEEVAATRAADFVAAINKLPKSVVQTGLFDKPLVQDWYSYMKSAINMEANLRTMHNFMGDEKVVTMAGKTAATSAENLAANDYKPLRDVWKTMGYSGDGLETFVLGRQRELKTQYDNLMDFATKTPDPADQKAAVEKAATLVSDAIDQLHVSPHAVNALKAYKAVLNPRIENSLTKAIDYVTNLYKGYLVTGPATNVRNLGSDFWQAIAEGNRNPLVLAKNYLRAGKNMGGKEELLPLLKEFQDLGGVTSGHVFDLTGKEGGRLLPRGMTGGLAGAFSEGSLNPFSPNNKLIRTNAQLMQYTDAVARAADWLTLREAGMSPANALYYIDKAHYGHAGATMTGFESNVMRRLIPFYGWCVPDHSEILTKDGWKTCDTVKIGEPTLTYNVKADRLEWQPVQEKAIFPYDNDLLVRSNARIKIESTPNHKWAILKRGYLHKRSYGKKNYQYNDLRSLKIANELNSRDCIIQSAELANGQPSILTPKQASLLGWLLTDGHYRWRKNHCEAVIYQSPKKFLKMVTEIAGGKPRLPHPDTGVVAVPVLLERVLPLKPYLVMPKTDLRWVGVVTQLSREAAEAMYEAMYQADATTSPKVRHKLGDKFSCQMPGVAAVFQVLSFLVGRPCGRQSKFGFYAHRKRHLGVKDLKKSYVHYHGRVWCPTTANGTWVMRQNGIVTITGNTRFNMPLQLQRLIERPGGITGQAVRIMGKGQVQSPGEEYTPQFLREGMALPVGGPPEARTFLRGSGLPIEDLNRFMFNKGVPEAGRTFEKFAAGLHPLINAPLETSANKQFYSGRKLSDLESTTKRLGAPEMPFLDRLLHYSPISRQLSDYERLTDPRKTGWQKALNLGTGLKFTTADVPKWEEIDLRNVLREQLAATPLVREYTSYGIPAGKKQEPGAAEAQKVMRRVAGISKRLKKIDQQRARVKMVAQ